MRKIAFLIMLMIPISVLSQNTKRGFRLLEKLDYEKAKEIFQEAVKANENVPSASFGLAVIYADENSPYYDLVEAWTHVKILESTLNNLTQDEIDFVGEYFVNTEVRRSGRPVKTKIEYAIAAIEAKLIKYVREENSLELVYEVIEKFPDFRHYDNLIHIRNQLEFRKYEKQNTIEGYRTFIEKFPKAAQYAKAQRHISKLSFEKALKNNNVESYKDFIKEFPESPEYNTALKNLNAVAFTEAKQANTMQAMENFIAEYPKALEVAEAKKMQKQLLYDYAKEIQTLEAFNEFIRKYPDGQQYIDIFNLKSLDLGMRFTTSNPLQSKNIQWARCFEDEELSVISSCVVTDSDNNYILGATVESSLEVHNVATDIWLIKTNGDGKMIWNKCIGENPHQELKSLRINKTGEIIGLGNTWKDSDSIVYVPWIFKLSADGQKMWSRTLDRKNICSMITTTSDNIVLGGYEVSDSLGTSYSLMVFNTLGRKIWERDYSVSGKIHGIFETADHQILISGTHWSALLNEKGYIKWESGLALNDSIVATTILPSGDIFYLGIRGNNTLLYKADAQNKKHYEKVIDRPDTLSTINSLTVGKDDMIATLLDYEDHHAIQWINAKTGIIDNTLDLPVAYHISAILTDQEQNLLLVVADGRVLLIKNFGISF